MYAEEIISPPLVYIRAVIEKANGRIIYRHYEWFKGGEVSHEELVAIIKKDLLQGERVCALYEVSKNETYEGFMY